MRSYVGRGPFGPRGATPLGALVVMLAMGVGQQLPSRQVFW